MGVPVDQVNRGRRFSGDSRDYDCMDAGSRAKQDARAESPSYKKTKPAPVRARAAGVAG